MKPFSEYFSFQSVARLLSKLRVKAAKQRHAHHMLRDVSSCKKHLQNFKEGLAAVPEVYGYLPPRRQWIRLKESLRKKSQNGDKIAVEEIWRTVRSHEIRNENSADPLPTWYVNLQGLVKEIQKTTTDFGQLQIKSPIILPKRKENTRHCLKFRPISQFSLVDRILIGQAAKYFTILFDDHFLDCSMAFRARRQSQSPPTHHDAIDKILSFLNNHQGKDIFVAECDIEKFFDCVEHQVLLQSFNQLKNNLLESEQPVDKVAEKIFLSYLECYSFNRSVLPLNANQYFEERQKSGGEFTWPKEALQAKFYPQGLENCSVGVPQGGALSCLIANILLHEVDSKVLDAIDLDKTLYLRFCDDMIMLSVDRTNLEAGLEVYMRSTEKKKLIVHEPQQFQSYDKQFYNVKSKSPYLWARDKSVANSSPWISFVGYQIKYDGSIRVRKKSLEKELTKQQAQVQLVLQAISFKDKTNLNNNSRKSKRQHIAALESRLINMAVGKIALHNTDKNSVKLCWGAGFKRLKSSTTTRTQLKHLDRSRNRELFVFKRKLSLLTKGSHNAEVLRSIGSFKGTPYSYFGLLARNL